MLAALTRPFKIWIARATIANLKAMRVEAADRDDKIRWAEISREIFDWQAYLAELRRQPGLWNTIKGKL